MSELEQLRKEVNELRERVAKLEARPAIPATQLFDWYRYPPQPIFTNPVMPFPIGTITC